MRAGTMRWAAIAGFLALGARSSEAQKEIKRPKLDAARDTNSAATYYYSGMQLLAKNPDRAADMFYWASRLDPSWADPYYARRIALLLTDSRRLGRYLMGNKPVVQSQEIRRIDSLQYEALVRNPFLYQKLNKTLYELYFEQETGLSAGLIDWDKQDPASAAWIAYSDGDFRKALDRYAKAQERVRKGVGFHGSRARTFFLVADYDSSLVEMQSMLDALRKQDKDEFVYVYDSKAMFEYSVGWIHAYRGDAAAAKAAFGRALTEDLSFYAAHAALARLAAKEGDSTTAMTEFDLSVQLKPNDASLRNDYGSFLVATRHYPEAEAQFRKAVEIEPFYAPPYFALGLMKEANGEYPAARQFLTDFLARSAQSDDDRRTRAQSLLASMPK